MKSLILKWFLGGCSLSSLSTNIALAEFGAEIGNNSEIQSPEKQPPENSADDRIKHPERRVEMVLGWTLMVDERLYRENESKLRICLTELEKQLQQIQDLLPSSAVEQLRRVKLYLTQAYPRIAPKAEYHVSRAWLQDNGRDPGMAGAIEFTNVEIFEQEVSRMPFFVLHELSHAYHDQFVDAGFANDLIKLSFERAKASGVYDKVERTLGNTENGEQRANVFEKSYALTNPMEYFAESTEAYFGINDFFPFNRQNLEQVDAPTARLIEKVWKIGHDKDSNSQ